MGGLIALVEGNADLAGSHLWDEISHTYNIPFIQKLFPGKRMALIHLAERQLGLILSPGNASKINGLQDLPNSGMRFINRQSGSGTRVWLIRPFGNWGLKGANFPGMILR
jgi:putative molybdopterin biosynthesis protein